MFIYVAVMIEKRRETGSVFFPVDWVFSTMISVLKRILAIGLFLFFVRMLVFLLYKPYTMLYNAHTMFCSVFSLYGFYEACIYYIGRAPLRFSRWSVHIH